jgi:hypothetical protein
MTRHVISLGGEHIEGELIESLECDFPTKTWTFAIQDDTQIGAGEYIAISVADLKRMAELREKTRAG